MPTRAQYKHYLSVGMIAVADAYIEAINKPHFSSDGSGIFRTDEEADAEIERRISAGMLPRTSD